MFTTPKFASLKNNPTAKWTVNTAAGVFEAGLAALATQAVLGTINNRVRLPRL